MRDDIPLTGFISSKAPALFCYLAITGRPHARQTVAFAQANSYRLDVLDFSQGIEGSLPREDAWPTTKEAASLAVAMDLYRGDFGPGFTSARPQPLRNEPSWNGSDCGNWPSGH